MNTDRKYVKMIHLRSIGQSTSGTYPSLFGFKKALSEGRVSGDYDKRITIVSNDPNEEYRFVK